MNDGVVERLGANRAPQALCLCVGFYECDALAAAPRRSQIVEGDLIDWEECCRCAELGRHVGNRRSVGEGDCCEPVAECLNVRTHDAVRAESLGDGEDEICCGGAGGEPPGQSQPHDGGDGREEWLAEQYRLGLDAANAEAEHAEARDHGGVRIGAHAAVREGEWCPVNLFDAHNGGEVLQVDLVHDAGSGRNDAELIEGTLRPAQQLVALSVALVLLGNVLLECLARCPAINLHRVVDHQVGGNLRIDAMRINA